MFETYCDAIDFDDFAGKKQKAILLFLGTKGQKRVFGLPDATDFLDDALLLAEENVDLTKAISTEFESKAQSKMRNLYTSRLLQTAQITVR